MITEPATLATDYALGALTAWLGWRLRDVARQTRQRSVRLWGLAFAATAIGSFAGGTYHGFVTALPSNVATATWKVATIAVGLAACLLLSAALISRFRPPARRSLLIIVWVQFVAYVAWVLGHDDFLYVVIEYGSAMLVVFFLQLFNHAASSNAARGWIMAGVCVTLVAAAIQQSGIDLHRHFNHNDLQHVVQMFAVWLLYKGGTRLTDADPGVKARSGGRLHTSHADE
jgi:hypothetical protein